MTFVSADEIDRLNRIQDQLMSTEELREIQQIKAERDALQRIVAVSQRVAAEAERVIALLIAAGIVDEDKIAQAREIARWK